MNEPIFEADKEAKDFKAEHADLKVVLPSTGETFYIDVTSKNHTSPKMNGRSREELDATQEKQKIEKYEEKASAEGARFIAFQFGTLSGLNDKARAFTKTLVQAAPVELDPKHLQHEIVCAIAAENSRIRRLARRNAK